MAKALDILANTDQQLDPVSANFEAMVAAAASFRSAAADLAQRLSYHTAAVGMAVIRQQFAADPRLAAIETLIAILEQQWPLVSSYDLPPIHEEPQPTGGE